MGEGYFAGIHHELSNGANFFLQESTHTPSIKVPLCLFMFDPGGTANQDYKPGEYSIPITLSLVIKVIEIIAKDSKSKDSLIYVDTSAIIEIFSINSLD